ncbi:carboxypeptidase-like regulatory domain-containing protein [Flavobacterium rakeshii]|uniref:carboxypeptidase-like regulatory domain-containing protein n=1 Tax=Flavobacterium rakeshii TaxID=1038845 RepID=UPI002E7B3BEF|nr:carboxypeptidase-like regulatory domain-containing protein [Flavobacterium rakeshii]MEE1899403.1 carboxypeptidase-like regulatory domain-containing protein [Flavobacterium rakeshii]
MRKPIQITIPQPCHEKWDEMTLADKGRFCASCQKNVIDFTKASDREIAEAYKSKKIECGVFLDTQLNRDLVVPVKKNNFWSATAAAVISFFAVGTAKSYAQESIPTEQLESKNDVAEGSDSDSFTIIWSVKDFFHTPLKNVKVSIENTGIKTRTDSEGNFTLTVKRGDIIKFKYKGKKTLRIEVTSGEKENVILKTHKQSKVTRTMGRWF